MTQFYIKGPFKIPTKVSDKGCRSIDVSKLDKFWSDCGDIAESRGCYVFSLKVAKGELPFYVGKAAKQSFRKECFSHHKRADHYHEILIERKGTPHVSFVVHHKTKGKWSQTAIDEIEEFLIARAAGRNKDLSNRRRLPYQSWSIAGVASSGKGKPTDQAKQFCKLMGVQRKS